MCCDEQYGNLIMLSAKITHWFKFYRGNFFITDVYLGVCRHEFVDILGMHEVITWDIAHIFTCIHSHSRMIEELPCMACNIPLPTLPFYMTMC